MLYPPVAELYSELSLIIYPVRVCSEGAAWSLPLGESSLQGYVCCSPPCEQPF